MEILEATTVHFVGVGGAGMSPLAELLALEGKTVTGSDLLESETTRHLRSVGVRVFIGHDARNLGAPQAVVHTAAIRADNPELAAARAAGIPLVRRADLLGSLMRRKRSVAVSGAHGKTTTTAMIGTILAHAGLDPTVIVGGSFRGGGTNLRHGRGDVIVVEADEYDRAFFSLGADVAVITNIDLEHLDTYRDLDDLKDAFVRFADSGPAAGVVVACDDSEHVAAIIPRLRRRCVPYGFFALFDRNENPIRKETDLIGCRAVSGAAGARFQLDHSGERLDVRLAVPGIHNCTNAFGAILAARELGIPLDVAAHALGEFRGMARRFESKGERNGVLVIDDYAHHPTEIKATLNTAREGYAARRLVAVFQPHLYSRTRDCAREFGEALLRAHVAMIAPIYAAREAPIAGVTSALIADAARAAMTPGQTCVHVFETDQQLSAALTAELRPGDLLITMGAGDVAKFADGLGSLTPGLRPERE